MECCRILLDRMQPVRDKLKDPSWKELVDACDKANVDLIATSTLSPLIDIGQIEGAFVMGLGLFLSEEIKYDPRTGKNLTPRLWDYFPPSTKDIPAYFRITLLKNAPNPYGVLKSKVLSADSMCNLIFDTWFPLASGEPPLCMSSVALLALQSAIHAARAETGETQWIPLDSPATVETVQLACNVTKDQLTYT